MIDSFDEFCESVYLVLLAINAAKQACLMIHCNCDTSVSQTTFILCHKSRVSQLSLQRLTVTYLNTVVKMSVTVWRTKYLFCRQDVTI